MDKEPIVNREIALQQLSTHDPCCSCSYLVYVYDTSTYHCYHQCKERNSRRQRQVMPYDRMSEDSRPSSGRSLCAWLLFAQMFIILTTILCGVWFGEYRGGFHWGDERFNYHPFLMTVGFVFAYGQGMLSFKMMQFCSTRVVQWIHGFINLLAVVCIIVGLNSVFDGRKYNLFSLHSWLGITTFILYCLQWVCGFITFIFPSLSMSTKAIYKQMHMFWGIVIFCGACTAIVTGVMDISITDYNKFTSEALMANFFGISAMLTATVVSYVVYNPDFIRQPQIEDEHIPIN